MNIFAITQMAVGIVLMLLIMIQSRASGLSSTFGGSGAVNVVQRRGAEKLLYQLSIILSIVFFGLAVARWFTF